MGGASRKLETVEKPHVPGMLPRNVAQTEGSRRLRTQWLKQDLQLVDRCVTPWVVLAMHRPMYVVYPHKSNRRVGCAFPRPF